MSYAAAVLVNVHSTNELRAKDSTAIIIIISECVCVCATPKTKQAINNYELEEKTSIHKQQRDNNTADCKISVCTAYYYFLDRRERERVTLDANLRRDFVVM